MPSSTSGRITVPYANDLIYETRAAVHAAHRAHKKGRPYGPLEITDGVVTVTLAYTADDGNGSVAGKAKRDAAAKK